MARIEPEGLPATREEAAAKGLKNYFTGVPCKHGHLAPRFTASTKCLDCVAAYMRRKYAESESHRNYAKDYQKRLRDSDPNYSKVRVERFKKRYHSDSEYRSKVLNRAKERRRNDPEFLEMRRLTCQKYARNNKTKIAAMNQLRRAASRLAKPKWLTADQLDQIEHFYLEARRITAETGVPHEVDHIVPLRGSNVCGLHVPWNLQVISRRENRSKFNRLLSDQSTFG